MTKKTMAHMTHAVHQFEQIKNSTEDHLVEIIQSSFSALATSNPKAALEVLSQIVAQKGSIESLAKEREEDQEEFVNMLSSKLPDSLEFDEEDSYEQ